MTTHNDYAGLYNIKISCQDVVNPPVVRKFDVLIIENFPPVINGHIDDVQEMTYTFFTLVIPQKFFTDPENLPLTVEFVPLTGEMPHFVEYIPSNYTVLFFP